MSSHSTTSPYLIPAMSLFVILLAVGAALHKERKKVSASLAELAITNEDISKTEQAIGIRNQILTNMKAAASPVDTFMKPWSDQLAKEKDANAILNDMSRFGNDMVVSVQGRRNNSGETMIRGAMVEVQYAQATGVSSEYHRLLNWLGAIEAAWPLGRFETVAIEARGTSQTTSTLAMQVRIAYPAFIQSRLNAK